MSRMNPLHSNGFYSFEKTRSRIIDVSNRGDYSLSRIVLRTRTTYVSEDKVSLAGHPRTTCNVRGLDEGKRNPRKSRNRANVALTYAGHFNNDDRTHTAGSPACANHVGNSRLYHLVKKTTP